MLELSASLVSSRSFWYAFCQEPTSDRHFCRTREVSTKNRRLDVDTGQASPLVFRGARVAVEVVASFDGGVHGIAEDVGVGRIVAFRARDWATGTCWLLMLAASHHVLE